MRTLVAAPAVDVAPHAAPAASDKPAVYDETADAKQLIASALERAAAENRRVLIQWGGNWCGWCIKLHDLYGKDAKVRKELLYEYDVVYVDIGQWNKNMELAAGYGAQLKETGVPYLTVLDAQGKVLANQATGPLEEGNAHDPAKVLAFLQSQKPAYWKADDLLAEAQAQAAKEGKHVLLKFGAPWCGWCHRLEDWMALPEPKALLARDYVIRKIDNDRMIGGKELYAKYRPENDGIPWFCVIDGEGKVLAASVTPENKNIGCPYEEAEIALFGEFLKATAKSLTADEIARLQASLGELKKSDQRKAAERKKKGA